jgi:hypothetical protein
VPGLNINELDIKALFRGPGQDTRQWISYGVVDPETSQTPSTEFSPDYGPLVNVTLQPSGIGVRCRVAMQVAGNGEADWHPFIQGDEVLVAIPEGDERAGCAIIGRLCNQIDQFPAQTGGQDATKNNFGFSRRRTPYMIETAFAWVVRSSTTGANITLDQTGNVTMTDGNNNYVHAGADFTGMQLGDSSALLQLMNNGVASLITMEVDSGGAKFVLAGQEIGCQMFTGGQMMLGAAGVPSVSHVTTTEAVIGMLAQLLPLIGTAITAALDAAIVTPMPGDPLGPLIGTPLAAIFNDVASLIPGMITTATTGSVADYIEAIQAALAAKTNDATGNIPSIGCPGILVG